MVVTIFATYMSMFYGVAPAVYVLCVGLFLECAKIVYNIPEDHPRRSRVIIGTLVLFMSLATYHSVMYPVYRDVYYMLYPKPWYHFFLN